MTELLQRLKGLVLGVLMPRRVVTVRAIEPAGCRFEIGSRVDAFRVERFGGEEAFVRRILDELSPGDTFYDIGACVGFVTIHAWKRVARVVAFEPDPGYGAKLATNLALNGAGSAITTVRWAVSDGDGEATLYTDGGDGASPSLMNKGGRGEVKVPTRAIDAAIAAGELPPPDVVKMDIEGAEILALRGMRALLRSESAPRAIFLELHPDMLPAFGASADDVRALLAEAGYAPQHEVARSAEMHFVFRKRS